jgi:hypothetical protein
VALVLGMASAACDKKSPPEPEGRVRLVAVPADGRSVAQVVADAQAKEPDRQLVIYVGATWCEPCKAFHEAAQRGELDARFPRLTLLEFDRDRDEARLGAAGCLSSLVPLFARPTSAGGCSERLRTMGAIKGEGAVDHITPRLERLLVESES